MISYKKIHPQLSVKDLHKTIDKMVCLEAYSKSEIKTVSYSFDIHNPLGSVYHFILNIDCTG